MPVVPLSQLPPEAVTIDPALQEVGANWEHQLLIHGSVKRDHLPITAFMVAMLVRPHPEGVGVVGRYYGTVLRAFEKRGSLQFYSCVGIGEVVWLDGQWRAVDDLD